MRGPIQGLYAIVDNSPVPPLSHESLALALLRGGARILQLRDKRRAESKEARERFFKAATQIAALKNHFSFLFLVNDDVETALQFGDGVHVGRDDPSIEECRRRLGPDRLIGYSSHSLEEAVAAESQGADYVAFGAIFPSPLKGPGHPVQGLGRLKEVVETLKVPVVAIGGINRSNMGAVKETGAAAWAMISALVQAEDITAETRWFSKMSPRREHPALPGRTMGVGGSGVRRLR